MKRYLLFWSIAILLLSCTKEKKIQLESELVLYPDSLQHHIAALLQSETSLLCVNHLQQFDTLYTFYNERNFKPLWWKALTGDSAAWEGVVNDLALCREHGLETTYYFLPFISYYREQLGQLSTADSSYNLLAELEILLSNSFVQMYKDIAIGRTNPKALYGYTYMLPYKPKAVDWGGFMESRKKKKWLNKLHENDTTYNQLVNLLSTFRLELVKEQGHPIDFSNYPKISPGDTAPIVQQVIRKLKSALEPDSSILTVEEDTIYTKEMVQTIQLLQEKYYLAADGVMGYKTYKVINSTAEERINQIKANLERERWFSRPDPDKAPFIYVNLPAYQVDLYYEDSVKSMKVCIGKNLPDNYDDLVNRYTDSGWVHKLPKDMETPQIAARVSQVVINPTWTVPKSIIKNEMYWQMRRDPTYLERNHYVVYDGDSLLDSETINWSRFKPNTVPYRIVQIPGEFNALGKVKFIFWNPFDIFMHDTPQKSKFKLPQRAVSHGCVRLENPLLFGEFAMQGSRKYDSDDFRIMMGYEPLDKERLEAWDPEDSTALIQPIDTLFKIRLEKSIPIYMVYKTITFNEEGQSHFSYDIYDRNKYILRKLEQF